MSLHNIINCFLIHQGIRKLPLILKVTPLVKQKQNHVESKASWPIYMCDVSVVKCEGNPNPKRCVVLAHALVHLIASVQAVKMCQENTDHFGYWQPS